MDFALGYLAGMIVMWAVAKVIQVEWKKDLEKLKTLKHGKNGKTLNGMDLGRIREVTAHSSGIIEVGSMTLYLPDRELQLDIEESSIKGNHKFRVYQAFGTDLTRSRDRGRPRDPSCPKRAAN